MGIGPPSFEVRIPSLDVREIIEALFLSDGPFAVGSPVAVMGGFPVGSHITVRFLNTVSRLQRDEVQQLTGICGVTVPGFESAIPCAMGLTFTYSETSDRERIEDAIQGGPRPPKNHIWVYDAPQGCTGGGDGFTHTYYEAGSSVTWAAIICLRSSRVQYEASHEMGHALGFQDLGRPEIFREHMMLHRTDECLLNPFEFAAVEAAYAAGLRPGARRQDFIRAGVIKP